MNGGREASEGANTVIVEGLGRTDLLWVHKNNMLLLTIHILVIRVTSIQERGKLLLTLNT